MNTPETIKAPAVNNTGGQNGKSSLPDSFRTHTIVIGGGQSGLSIGYRLSQQKIPFLILDAHARVGDAWRKRWDSLRLFTPAKYNGLVGRKFPARPHYFPTKDEMADFLEDYARRFNLPVRNSIKVDSLTKENGRFVVRAGSHRFEADNVVVAMASYQQPRVPTFANELDTGIRQFHSGTYRNPQQLQEGPVLIVGGGNSGSELAMELSKSHKVYMSGRDTGHVPFRIASAWSRFIFMPFVLRFVFHRIFTIRTFIGRKVRSKILTAGGPLIRVKPDDLKRAGVERVPKTDGVNNGRPVLADGRVMEVKNVIWCTGFQPGFSWIKLPVMGVHEPLHRAGIVDAQPGLYFTGLHFLYSLSSSMVQGTVRDSKRIVNHLVKRARVEK